MNKNIVLSDNQITITRSHLMPTQNDQVVLSDKAKVADAILPAAVVNVKATESETQEAGSMYRQAFMYPKDGEADDAMPKQEQLGLGGIGWGVGWRYPLDYWNRFGAGLYCGRCGLGIGCGGFYYC